MRIDRMLVGALVTLTLAGSVLAQGLGDAANREAERRKAAQQKATPSKSYGDQDLPSSQAGAPPLDAPTEDAGEPSAEPEGDQGVAVAPGVAVSGSLMGKGRTAKTKAPPPRAESSAPSSSESYGQNPGSEASWRAAASGARRKIQDAEKRVAELDAKAASLMYAPTGGDCNLGSAANHMTYEEIKRYKCVDAGTQWQGDRKRTLDDLEKAKAELEQARKDQETMQESARRQGALPGWLRE